MVPFVSGSRLPVAHREHTRSRARSRHGPTELCRPLTPYCHRIIAGTTVFESRRPHVPRILAKGHGSPPRGSNAPITVRPPLMSSDYKVPSRTLAPPILHMPPPWWLHHTAPFQRGGREEGKEGKGGAIRRNRDRGGAQSKLVGDEGGAARLLLHQGAPPHCTTTALHCSESPPHRHPTTASPR
jgi:hypothetical protein